MKLSGHGEDWRVWCRWEVRAALEDELHRLKDELAAQRAKGIIDADRAQIYAEEIAKAAEALKAT